MRLRLSASSRSSAAFSVRIVRSFNCSCFARFFRFHFASLNGFLLSRHIELSLICHHFLQISMGSDADNDRSVPSNSQMEASQPFDSEEHSSKRMKLEATESSSALDTTASSHPSSTPTAPSVHDIEATLHGVDEADHGLAHNTVAGELIEHEQLEQQQRQHDGEQPTNSSDTADSEEQINKVRHSSSLSISSSPAASPLPPQPFVPASPPPLGKYQCDNCGALLTYSSLTEIYHCPMCYHTFTLYPNLAQPPPRPSSHSPTAPSRLSFTRRSLSGLPPTCTSIYITYRACRPSLPSRYQPVWMVVTS